MKEIDKELKKAVSEALDFSLVAHAVGAYEVAVQDFINELSVQGYKIVEVGS